MNIIIYVQRSLYLSYGGDLRRYSITRSIKNKTEREYQDVGVENKVNREVAWVSNSFGQSSCSPLRKRWYLTSSTL